MTTVFSETTAFDLVANNSAPAAMQALVGGSLNVTTGTPEASWPAQDKEPNVKQILAIANVADDAGLRDAYAQASGTAP